MPEIHLPRLIGHLAHNQFAAGERQQQDFQDLRIIRLGLTQLGVLAPVIPAKAGIQRSNSSGMLLLRSLYDLWTPAFAGVTVAAFQVRNSYQDRTYAVERGFFR